MRRFSILASSAIFIVWAFGHSASAANVKDVLGACDRTPGCGYSQNKNGDISGCSKNACFYCPADGSRQCTGATKGSAARTGGSSKDVIDIGGVKLQRGPVPVANINTKSKTKTAVPKSSGATKAH